MALGRMVGLEEMACALAEADDFAICGHMSPDGDCLGSQLALAHALEKMGKRVTCLLARDEEIEYGLRFLPRLEEAVPAAGFEGAPESFVAVDVPNAQRMGNDAAALHRAARRTFTIDHHLSDAPMSQLNYVDPAAAAAALIVWKLVPYLGVEYDPDIATCCYAGLITDCGRFTYQNTDAAALRAASEMLDTGIDPSRIAVEIYQNRSRASISLERRVIERIEYLKGGSVAISYLKRSDFVETNAIKMDAEPMIDLLRCIRGVNVCCMLREQDGQVRGSLRAKDDTDVAAVAGVYGGGGHKAAAGFTYVGSLEDARRDLRKALSDL